MDLKNKKIGVLMGGISQEREISLRSGRAVASALKTKGYHVVEIDVGRDVSERLKGGNIDVAVVMLHGRFGEDGTIQGLLEIMKIPYTGSGPLGSAVAMDKEMTKRLARQAGIRTPTWQMIHRREAGEGLFQPVEREENLHLPIIVKPNREGSTIGMSIVRQDRDWVKALQEAFFYDDQILVEEFIQGVEVTVGILDGKTLPPLEIVPKGGFYDYQSKYTKGMTEYIIPARISEKAKQAISQVTEEVFSLLRLSGVARMDFILTPEDNEYFLEANTIPGMTETSLVPKAAAAVGIGFDDLCERILEGAGTKV